MQLNHLILICLFFCAPFRPSAQTRTIDSLRLKLKSIPDQSLNRFPVLLSLCAQYNSLHPDSLTSYILQTRSLALQRGIPDEIAESEYYEATWYNKKGKPDSAILLIDKNLANLDPIKQHLLRGRFLLSKGTALMRENKQKEAMENALYTLNEAETHLDAELMMKSEIHIGWVNMELGKNREALNWFFDAIEKGRERQINYEPAILYSDIAAVYNELNLNDSAEIFIIQAMELARQQDDLTFFTNACYIYSDICSDKGNIEKAEEMMQLGLKTRKQTGDMFYIVSDISQLGIFYATNHQPAKGITVLQEGIRYAEQNNLNAKLPLLYSALADNYKAAGNDHLYAETLNKVIALKDTMYLKNSAEALAEIQTKYELQKKENTIIQQKYDLTRKNYFLFGSLGLLAVTVTIGLMVFRNRRKIQELKIRSLEMEQKKKTALAILQAEEEERKRIAADLHDSVAQKMVAAKLNLESLGNKVSGMNAQEIKVYENIHSLLDESATEVRNLSHAMMPRTISHSGITEAVKYLLDKLQNPGLKLRFNAEGNFTSITENSGLMVYRVIQECLQNALKHAHASQLDVTMIVEKKELEVMIEDNGTGFDPVLVKENGLGLKNIRSRIEYLNGKLEINSRPGKGTVIAFYIPIEPS